MNHSSNRHRLKRWLTVPLLVLAAGFATRSALAGPILTTPPAMVEVTALSGQTRLGSIIGGVTMAKNGKYYVTALLRASNPQLPGLVKAWNSNDTVLWTNSFPTN